MKVTLKFCFLFTAFQVIFGQLLMSNFDIHIDKLLNSTNIIGRYFVSGQLECAQVCNGNDTCQGANLQKEQSYEWNYMYICDLFWKIGSTDLANSLDNIVLIKDVIAVDYCSKQVTNPCQNWEVCVSGPTNYTCLCPSHCSGAACDCCTPSTFPGRVETAVLHATTVDVFVETDGGGREWIVLMRRHDGSQDFVNRDWVHYKNGFGDLTSEFWLGNDNIHYLTNNGSTWMVRFDLKSFGGECRHAESASFALDSEEEWYQMHLEGYDIASDAANSMGFSNGRNFSTRDSDNDLHSRRNCATSYGGGWWYDSCFIAKLTGAYGESVGPNNGIIWTGWLGRATGLKYADMKIRVV